MSTASNAGTPRTATNAGTPHTPANPAANETPKPEAPGNRKRRLIGRVTSDKMQKTVVVEVQRYKRDPVYKKYIRERSRYKAHDEKNEYKVGDRVEIIEYRPMSRDKRFKVVRLIERPAVELTQKEPVA